MSPSEYNVLSFVSRLDNTVVVLLPWLKLMAALVLASSIAFFAKKLARPNQRAM